jgi:D-alanyl-D-alanine carboxypeptidase (penicillin-binding protein 5/6)
MKRWLSVLFALALAAPMFAQEEGTSGEAKGAQVDMTGKGYTAAYVIEPTTRRVLFEENANVQLPTASMAKMMTLLIAMEDIKSGRLHLNDQVITSARAAKMGGSQIYAKEGQSFDVQTLLAATMIQSANDSAEMLAEKIAGSAESFADMMNQRAKQLGLTQSIFYDPHGLPNAANSQQIDKMSAHDLAILGIELMKYPLMQQYAKTPTFPFTNGTFTSGLTNPNHLINPHKVNYWPEATGIKTGYSGPAGYCVTASAHRGDMDVIAVVMGAKSPNGPSSSFGIAQRLMSNAFAQYSMMPVLKKGARVGQANVSEGAEKTVPAVASQDVKALLKRGEEGQVKVAFAGGTVVAPVRAGQPVGTVVVSFPGGNQKVPAVAGGAVDKQAWWKKFWPF